MAKIPSWRKKKKNSTKKIFVGRQKQLDLFQENVNKGPNDEDFQNIFNIYGQGGVGKSTLISKYIDIANQKDYVSVFIDTEDKRTYDVLATMNLIAADFERQGFPFKKFNETYEQYLQETKSIEADPEKPPGLFGAIISSGIKGGAELAADFVPGGKTINKLLSTNTLADRAGEHLDYLWEKFKNKDKVKLISEPLKVLSPLWLEDLGTCMSKKNIALFFDTYEVVNPILDQWIYDIINDHYGDFPNSNFLLVIGGRDKISKEGNWEALKEYIEDIELKAFTKKEAIAYLEKAGITKPETVNFILEASKRLPVYLSLLSEGSPDSPEEVGDPKEQIVGRFLKHIKEPVKRQLALSAALCQRIDKDIVECLLSEDQKANALDYFNWLKDRPFIRKIGGKWAYHSLVREIMLKYQKELSLLDWENVHNSLALFYKNRMDDLGIEDREKQFVNQDFNNYHIEYSYHKLSANYTKFIPETVRDFVTIIANQSYYSALPLVKTLLQAETLNRNADWGKLIEKGLSQLISDGAKGNDVKKIINNIISSDFVKNKDEKGSLYYLLASVFYYSDDNAKAVASLKKAIELKPDDASAYNNLGVTLRAENDNTGAIAAYKKAIELKPDDASAYYNLGNSLRDENDNTGAIAAYKKAIELKPDYASAYNNLGNSLRAENDNTGAIAAYKKAIELKPDYALAYNNLGNSLRAENDNTGAIAAYKKAIELKPDDASAYYNLGNSLRAENDNTGAIAAYKKSIELKPDDASAYYNLGNSLSDENDNTGAIAAYKKSIELKPDDASAYNNLGNSLRAENDNTGAIAAYKKAIELKPDDASAYYNLGNSLRAENDNTGAIAAYKKSIELKPDDASAYYNLGVTLSAENDNTGAIAAYKKAIELKPDDASAYYNLGNSLRAENDNTGAIAAYKKAIELKPDYASAYYNLGVTLSAENDNTGAIAAYKKAIELKPDDASAYNNLGNSLSDENDNTGAIAAYKKAIELKPDYASAYNNLGVTLSAENDNTGAIAAYKKAIELKPDYASAYYNLGVLFSNKENYEDAISSYGKVIELKSDDADAWHSIGWNYLLWDKLKEAAFNLEKSWELYEHKSGLPPMNLGHIFLFQKDEEQAKKWYKLSLPLWEDKNEFFSGMDSDYTDLKMEERGISKSKYEEIINELKA